MKAIPVEFQNVLVVADIDKKISDVMRRTQIEENKENFAEE